MLGGAGSPGGDDLLTVTIVRDEHGYGMKVSGDNPVYVQSVKEHGAAWRAGLRAGDRILRVDSVPVHHHTHQQVVHMIRASPTTVLTVQQNASRHKTPITAPVPVNPEKQRQLDASKARTVRMMLDQELKYIRDLRHELTKVPDVRKQAQLEAAELRCAKLQREVDASSASSAYSASSASQGALASDGGTPVGARRGTPPGFLSALPRSLSNLTGQSLRNLRQARLNKTQEAPPLLRQHSEHAHAHAHAPPEPTTCLDTASPPPLPPRSADRRRSPPVDPLARPKPAPSEPKYPMHRSMPPYQERRLRSAHSLDGDLEGPQPNSIALQMSYPLVNVPPPPLQTDNRSHVPVLHVRSRSSPEQLDTEAPPIPRPCTADEKESWERGTPPPGTPPPPYAHNTQPCADPQRAIISMEEDDSPSSDNSLYSGLFSNLRSVRESKARTAVLLNWLLGERRCACASLLLIVTDGYRAASGVPAPTLRRWAYEIHSTFLIPNAVLQLNGVDENMANEIEHVLVNEYEKEELLRNVFRKARQKAKEELSQQLSEFQVKRKVGLASLYAPDDPVLEKCDVDKAQELVVVERLLCQRLSEAAGRESSPALAACGAQSSEANAALLAALIAAALCLHCRPASVAAAVGGSRASFLQRDKLYKQRVKQLAKQHPQPYVVRGHHLQLQALTSVGHCHHCDHVIWGLAPQAYVCTDCKLRVHRTCAKSVEEGCCMDGEHHNNRISRFMERIHPNNQLNNQDTGDKKSRKTSNTNHFLNMERSFRKMEDEQPWDQTLTPASSQERRDESDESLYESADCHSDAISASDDALPRLGKTPTLSKESLKLAVTDEEVDIIRNKKGHRKTMSLSNPLEIVKNLGDEWFDSAKKDLEKASDKKKSRESLWSEEDRDSIHGSNMKLDQIRKNSKKEDKSQSNSRKSSTADAPKRKSSKGASVSALNLFRRKKTPTSMKPVEVLSEDAVDKGTSIEEILNSTLLFLEGEKRHASICDSKPPQESDSDDEPPTPKILGEHRRRLSRQTSRGKSKVRGKSQSVKVNTLRKSHSGTLKKAKKKSVKTPSIGRSRQASIVEQTPIAKKKNSDSVKHSSWFSSSRGEARREGSAEEQTAPDADVDTSDTTAKETPDKDNNWRAPPTGRGVNRAESCRERDAPRRGKHRNASDPNRLTAHNNHDLEPGATTAPSGSSSSSSLSSRSNESNTVAAEQQASQSDWSEEDEPLAAQWADSLPPHVLESLQLSSRLRKRQEVIHELIVSEGSHVRWLKVLCRVFLRPLEAAPSLLPSEELRALFPNLPDVRDWHATLHTQLRTLRSNAPGHVVPLGGLAETMLGTLGEASYAACLSRFCRGQRLALEALRERRRKNKELHQFLASREQLPLCGRLQLRDLLACVWQRLTKYRLLLESVLKTVSSEDSEEDVAKLQRALDEAKYMLHSVDTAIRATENEHRLRTIQNKLEVRVERGSGAEWDELKRLDLTQHRLRLEGDLTLRHDSSKKIAMLALMFEEMLVLLQREGDKYVLKPIPQPSQHAALSPLIKWDKVLFRPNAAVRNTFFLMNINGVQMHELSANTNADYNTWVNYIQEAPLARVELKQSITPSHQASRSTDDSGINVSRNPSDASEKSNLTAEDTEPERDRLSLERAESERDKTSVERTVESDKERTTEDEGKEKEKEDKCEKEPESVEREEKHIPRRPTVGRISTHGSGASPGLEPTHAITVRPPVAETIAHTAETAYTYQEQLRRLDEGIRAALAAKSAIVGRVLGVSPPAYTHLAELAVAEALGEVDIQRELRATRQSSRDSSDDDAQLEPDLRQLLLAAHEQANQLTEAISKALTVNEAAVVAARARRGRCNNCRGSVVSPHSAQSPPAQAQQAVASVASVVTPVASLVTPTVNRSSVAESPEAPKSLDDSIDPSLDRVVRESLSLLEHSLTSEASFDLLRDADDARAANPEGSAEEALESNASAALLAASLARLSCGVQSSVSRLLHAHAHAHAHLALRSSALRAELAAGRERADRLQAAARPLRRGPDCQMTDEIYFIKPEAEPIQDQPSNGG